MIHLRNAALVVLILFILPALATAGWWSMTDRPTSWRAADWSSSGLLPAADADDEAAIYVLAARTGGFKGAFAVHSWIVLKRPGASGYERYDKVGWGNPIRRDGYAADGRWYSNAPWVVRMVRGEEAEELLPAFDRAIAQYPYAERGGYRIWPGPNSNTFVAHVLAEVPQFGGRLPPNAVGRDFAPMPGAARLSLEGLILEANLAGVAGISLGRDRGLEIHFAGLVAGLDPRHLALTVPALGSIGPALSAEP